MSQPHGFTKNLQTALVALGANVAKEFKNNMLEILGAKQRLDKRLGQKSKIGAFYRTPAFPKGAGPDFVNAALSVTWAGTAHELLEILHQIEADMGRERKTRWGPRVIDLDLLALGDAVLPDLETHAFWRGIGVAEQQKLTPDQLILPHPRLSERAFVLVPLCDIAPDWVHPILGKTVREMRDGLKKAELDEVIALENPS